MFNRIHSLWLATAVLARLMRNTGDDLYHFLLTQTESAPSIMSETSASDAGPEPAKSSAPAPAPQAEARRAEPAENGLSGSDAPAQMADQPIRFEALQAEPAVNQPRFLKAIDGETTVFEKCDGRLFKYDIPTAPSLGWFEVEWSQDGCIGEVTSRGIESPCEAP